MVYLAMQVMPRLYLTWVIPRLYVGYNKAM